MKIITIPENMYAWSMQQKAEGKSIGLVPTMGYFHEGHLSLMRKADELCDVAIVSLFVNPTQFGPNEDLDRYPRDFERDVELSKKQGVKVLFAPQADAMYAKGCSTEVHVSGLTENLCGAHRPGHFTGVATVVTKLINMVQPDVTIFGEKDFQQLAVIRRFAQDLNLPTKIMGHSIVRESDGLAMSSRNVNLDPANRAAALSLSQGLHLARQAVQQGERNVISLAGDVQQHILSQQGTAIDYVSFVHCDTLKDVETVDDNTVLALAVKIDDKVRLIDNGFLIEKDN